MTRVLIIDDEESICWGLTQVCQQLGWSSSTASSAEQGLELVRRDDPDLIVMDIRLPGIDGLTAIQQMRVIWGAKPIITMTAFGDLETAIEAVQKGAFDYLVKPFELAEVREAMQQAVAASHLMSRKDDAVSGQRSVADEPPTRQLIGSSAAMQQVYKQIALATTTDSPVLITGESGTGKELTARSIHAFGPRAEAPFVAVNLAALNPSLAESELFGHVRGAFTGADHDRVGLIEQASGGTLFLDEVAEIPLTLQVKLLRVLDQQEITPVGSNRAVRTNFRLLSATHQDLLGQLHHGDFRHDLFYRLRTLEIRLPPLRERKQDLAELVEFLVASETLPADRSISISDEFVDALRQHDWPGNVRELAGVVSRAVTLARGGVLTAEHVEFRISGPPTTGTGLPIDAASELTALVEAWTREAWRRGDESIHARLLELLERPLFETAFELADHQYSAASRRLGVHRTTLKKRLDEFPVDPPSSSAD